MWTFVVGRALITPVPPATDFDIRNKRFVCMARHTVPRIDQPPIRRVWILGGMGNVLLATRAAHIIYMTWKNDVNCFCSVVRSTHSFANAIGVAGQSVEQTDLSILNTNAPIFLFSLCAPIFSLLLLWSYFRGSLALWHAGCMYVYCVPYLGYGWQPTKIFSISAHGIEYNLCVCVCVNCENTLIIWAKLFEI